LLEAVSDWHTDTFVVARTFDEFLRRIEREVTEAGFSLLAPRDDE
jgi:hypothetical protein